MQTNKQAFYMIYVEGGNSPRKTHADLFSAQREARRLAKLTHRKVYVLSSLKAISYNQWVEEDCTPTVPYHDLLF